LTKAQVTVDDSEDDSEFSLSGTCSMSTLLRMKREIGFRQLLVRLETCPHDERERFLASIAADDPGRAALLRTKSLSLDRVLKWDPTILAHVFSGLAPRTLACLMAISPHEMEIATNCLSNNYLKNVNALGRTQPFTENDMEAARIQLFTHIRELERLGELTLDQIDPVAAAPAATSEASAA
jgi:flagellar motor switch protein FliG